MSSNVTRLLKNAIKDCIRPILIPIVYLARKKKKTIILLMDRRNEAGDNAEAMYHYLRPKEDCETYFILSHNSKDWNRLQPDDHVIDIHSVKYVWIYMRADLIMFSHEINHPRGMHVVADKIGFKKVFLQHGVIHEDLSRIYNASQGHDLVCVATKDEYLDRQRPAYGYRPEQICLTGLPRFDYLEKRTEKIITIALTWRKYLKPVSISEFQASAYFLMIKQLIFMPELSNLAEKYGYSIQFVPHPKIDRDIIHLLEENQDQRLVINTHQTYSEIISETALMITDYSSIAFDAAYLKIPILYFQTDKEEFYSGKHSYTIGYFDFERDGFGEVFFDVSKLISVVENYLQQGCKMKPIYVNRVLNTFNYIDNKNCERVYEALMQIRT